MKNKIIKSASAGAIIGLVIICLAFKGDQSNSLSKTERANGWRLLFDGHSTAGWHLYNGSAQFTVWKAKDGALVCDPLDKSGTGDLITDQEFKDFDLKFDWKLPKGGNSGVFINVLERKDVPTGWASGPEYQLLDNANPDYRSGYLFGMSSQKNPAKTKPADAWNHSEIKQKNGKIQFYLNGVLT